MSSQISLQEIDKKICSETMAFPSRQLRQFPQIKIALDNYNRVYVYVITKLYDVIICCYGDILYHKRLLNFFNKDSMR